MNRRILPCFALSIALLSNCTTTAPQPRVAVEAAPQSRLSERVPLDPELRFGTLPNGLTYYIRVNRKPQQRAELRLAVDTGSVLEGEEQRGLAHFVEHMAFNGTENFKKQELVNYLERIGMRFGPDLNAYTSFDETVYMLQVPTDDPQIIDTAFRILRDWSSAVSFEEEEVEKERGVVIEEWRLGRSASGRIRDKQFPVVFHGSRYAERLPIGKKETLEKATADDLQKFYAKWYRPDLTAVIAVGDFDPERIEALIREHFSGIERPQRAAERSEFPIPDHAETLVSVATDPEATGITVQVEYKRPEIPRGTVADLRQSLADSLYHHMMNERLRELSQVADPPYQFAFAGSGPLGRTKSTYRLFARVNDGGVERGLRTLLTEARRVEHHGFSDSELQRAKTGFVRSIERLYEERETQESGRFASQYVDHFLDDNPAPGIAYIHKLFNELVPGITLTEINARADQWISDTNRVVLVSGPDKIEARIPDETRLLGVFREAEQLAVTPWVDQVRNEPLVAQTPSPGRIVEESRIEEIGVTRWKLSNGAVVLLKPTDFKNDEILLRGWSPGGHSLAPDSIHFSAMHAPRIVAQMGLGNFTRTELGKALAGKAVSLNADISLLSEGIEGSASPKDLETLFQLLYLRFTGARRDEEAFASFMSNLRGQLENQEASPDHWFFRKLNEVMTQNHPRRRLLTLAELDQIKLDEALNLYRQRFADASDFVFMIVGNVDVAAVRPLVEKWIGGLPASGRKEAWRDLGVREPQGVHRFEVKKGIEPRSTVRILFHGDARWNLDEAHQIASMAEVLRIRLREELREDRGGVYGVSVSGSLSHHPLEAYSVRISFSADPQRVDELLEAVFDEIEKLKKDGPAEDYVNRVREGQRRQREVSLKRNPFWASQLEFVVSNDVPFAEILRYDERIKAVTPQSVQQAARKYLDTKRYVIGVLNPEKEAPAAAPAAAVAPSPR